MSDPTHDELLALSHAYALAVDGRDLPALRALFAPGGVLAVTAVGDPATIVSERSGDALAEIIDRIGRFDRTEHRVGPSRFAWADDGTATGRIEGEAHHHSTTADGPQDWVLTIEYADRYALMPEGWRFSRRTVQVLRTETATQV